MDEKLRKEAEDLGISVDSRWSDTTLSARIDEKKADNKAAGPGGIIPGATDIEGPSKEAHAGAAVYQGKVLPTEATPKAVKSGIAVPADEKARLVLKAQTLLIEVDDKWDADRLRGEIQFSHEGRADLQVKGAIPPAEICAVDYDPATKADKQGKIAGITPVDPVKVPGVTIAGEPAVMVPGQAGQAVATSTVVTK